MSNNYFYCHSERREESHFVTGDSSVVTLHQNNSYVGDVL